MNSDRRERLIESYFDALDEPDYESLRSVFSDDVTYDYPGESSLEGFDDVLDFFEHRKPTSDTAHEVDRILHTEEASVCEGRATGELAGDSFEAQFCDVIEFDESEHRIVKLSVYNSSR